VVILGVHFEVLGEVVDPAGENCYLHIRRPGIFVMETMLSDDFGFVHMVVPPTGHGAPVV
jgi:hypothetical protein